MSLELTQEQRKQVYEEEKSKIEEQESCCSAHSITLMVLATTAAVLAMIGIIQISKHKTIRPKIEDLRKAYPGL